MPWGRQIAVAMTPADERIFVEHLRGEADLTLLRPLAPRNESLVVPELPGRRRGAETFYLWNRHFGWEPTPAPTLDGQSVYLLAPEAAPLIEYLRDPLPGTTGHGRLYWGKSPSPDGPFEVDGLRYAYDFEAFERWYTSVTQWVRARSARFRHGRMTVHCLPDAARIYGV